MRQNLGYKILALALAVVLWAKVNGDRNPNIKTPVGFVNVAYMLLPSGLVLTDAPARIQVSATGPQSALRGLNVSQLKAVVDLSDAQPGTRDFPVDISGPPDVADKVRLSPTQIKAKIETFARKSLKIDVSLEGVPPLGFSFGAADIYGVGPYRAYADYAIRPAEYGYHRGIDADGDHPERVRRLADYRGTYDHGFGRLRFDQFEFRRDARGFDSEAFDLVAAGVQSDDGVIVVPM